MADLDVTALAAQLLATRLASTFRHHLKDIV
jgi:hypothetical protein